MLVRLWFTVGGYGVLCFVWLVVLFGLFVCLNELVLLILFGLIDDLVDLL